jgi:superfamily II DNA or RNA helicase
MTFELREYQKKLSHDVSKALSKYKRVIMCLDTGGGKTVIALDFILRALSKDFTLCFLADRDNLLDQALKDLIALVPNISIIKAENKVILPSNCYVGMVETYYRRFSQGKIQRKPNLYILDECHIGNYNKVIDVDPDAYVIGLTATPVASAANEPLNKRYQTIICGPPTSWLIENKFLVPAVDIGHDKILEFQVQNGEFSSKSQVEQFSQNKIDDLMIKIWKKLCSDRHTICYNIDIEHNKKVTEMFRKIGVEVAAVDYKTHPDERNRIIGVFKKGLIQVLCNVGIVAKGFDSKMTSCIVLNVGTASFSRYRQWIGRGARPYPDKDNFYMIDMANNRLRHGSFNDDVDWKLLFQSDSRDKSFKVKHTYKVCPVCYKYLTNFFIIECDVCGNDFRKNPMLAIKDIIPPELQKPIDDMSFKELKLYAQLKGYKHNWAYMQAFGNKKTWSKK